MGPERLFLRPASLILALSVAAASASCGDETGGAGGEALPDDALVLVVSTDLAVGRERVLVSALDRDNRSLVTDRPVNLAFFAPDGAAAEEAPARFVWAVPDVRGMWTAQVVFDTPGVWSVAVRTTDDRLVRGAPVQRGPPPRAPSGWGKERPLPDPRRRPTAPWSRSPATQTPTPVCTG